MPYDPSLAKYDIGYRSKLELGIMESRYTNFLLRKMGFRGLLFPDSKWTFHRQWTKVVQKFKTPPDLIYSRSNPMSSAMLAARLKKHYQKPWIMHMSDPWALSPLHDLASPRTLTVEREWISRADAVTFTSEKTKLLYEKTYPTYSPKFHILPNVFDPEDATLHSAVPQEGVLRIVYTGGLAGSRSASFLKDVVSRLEQQVGSLESRLEILFAGDADSANREFFRNAPSCIRHLGMLNYGSVRELYRLAHLLMVIDSPTSSANAVYFPSKLLDYFAAQRKIFAITPEGSTTRDLLRGYPHEAFEHAAVNGMVDFLRRSLHHLVAGEYQFFESRQLPSQFDASVNAGQLLQLIRRLV